MSEFDPYKQWQRLAEEMRPALDQMRQLFQNDRLAAIARSAAPMLDTFRELERAQRLFQPPVGLLEMSERVRATTLPLVDLAALAKHQIFLDADMMLRLTNAFKEAALVGEVSIEEEEELPEGEAPTREADPEKLEGQLIQIASVETLETLRTVEFAPIVLLDRVLRDPKLLLQLEARRFEQFVASLVEELGFEEVVLTPRSADEGRDVLATKRVHGIPILFAFECKRYAADRPVGPEIARALLGTIVHGKTRANKGVLVTTSRFTPATRQFILTEPNLDGKDFDGIVAWLKEYGSKR